MKTIEDRRVVKPVSSIWEEGDRIEVRLEMPGVAKDDLDVQIENEKLHVIGRTPATEVNGEFILQERAGVDYEASFALDEKIDPEKVEAHLDNGVLRITLRMRDEVKPRRIAIK